jgi:transposase
MRRIRELLRLRFGAGASDRAIARNLGVARSTVQEYLARAATAGLTWPLPDELSDEVLEERLFAGAGTKPGLRRRIEPDWAALVREMKRPGVNLTVLWEEYRDTQPSGYAYSRFCELFREFEHQLTPTMRQHHVAGDKVFVDYSGKTIAIIDPTTGEMRSAEIFVAVLGASNYTYAEASWSQTLPDWIAAHVRMFQFYNGCTRLIVPDNLRSAVNKPSFYDPEVNRTYGKMAAHYGVGVLAARPYHPRDKAIVSYCTLFC